MKNIVVDLNASKGPNTYGKDVFWFDLDPDKGLMPNGYASSTTTVNNNCKTGAGASYCATKIMRDGWEIKSDYPWD